MLEWCFLHDIFVVFVLHLEWITALCAFDVLQLEVKGYSDKLEILLRKILDRLSNFTINQQRFDIIKEAVSTPCFTDFYIWEIRSDKKNMRGLLV